jgi:hypothetical protein
MPPQQYRPEQRHRPPAQSGDAFKQSVSLYEAAVQVDNQWSVWAAIAPRGYNLLINHIVRFPQIFKRQIKEPPSFAQHPPRQAALQCLREDLPIIPFKGLTW